MTDQSNEPGAADSPIEPPASELSPPARSGPPRWVLLLAGQVLIVGGLTAWAGYTIVHRKAERNLPPLLEEPRDVPPLYDRPEVISDEQLHGVLLKLRPRNEGHTSVNHVDHALRFWTVKADFKDPKKFLSGKRMRRILTDHRIFSSVYGEGVPPLLIDEGSLVRVRETEGPRTTSSHVDHTMAGLAEAGTPLSYPIITPTRQTTFRALVERALREFTLNRYEYEWSILTFALFLDVKAGDTWLTSEGQEMSFDRMARRLIREPMPHGVCHGSHRLHTLVVLLRVDDEDNILTPAARQEVIEFLKDMTRRLIRNQHADGFWNGDWPYRQPVSREPTDGPRDQLSSRIIGTGHALEWWALAPRETHPDQVDPEKGRDTVRKAAQWLVRLVGDKPEKGMNADEVAANYTFLTHAGRALTLWRGKTPPEVDPNWSVRER